MIKIVNFFAHVCLGAFKYEMHIDRQTDNFFIITQLCLKLIQMEKQNSK